MQAAKKIVNSIKRYTELRLFDTDADISKPDTFSIAISTFLSAIRSFYMVDIASFDSFGKASIISVFCSSASNTSGIPHVFYTSSRKYSSSSIGMKAFTHK